MCGGVAPFLTESHNSMFFATNYRTIWKNAYFCIIEVPNIDSESLFLIVVPNRDLELQFLITVPNCAPN